MLGTYLVSLMNVTVRCIPLIESRDRSDLGLEEEGGVVASLTTDES